jgi:GlpG protein
LREIGTIATERQAKLLADHLLTLNISTKLVAKADRSGWVVWVHREERVPEARKILEAFEREPENPRFAASAVEARGIRKQAERIEKAYRRNVKEMRERWDAPLYQRAPLTFALLLGSVLVAVSGLAGVPEDWLDRLYFSYKEFVDPGVWVDVGFEPMRQGEVWRLITPIFLHFGIWHLVLNMFALIKLGERIEMRKGTARLAVIALVAAIGGNVGQYYATGPEFGGMSGVVFAFAGYLWAKGHAHPEDGLSLSDRQAQLMILWFLMGMTASLSPHPELFGFFAHMANVAHGVGLASGMLLGLLRL